MGAFDRDLSIFLGYHKTISDYLDQILHITDEYDKAVDDALRAAKITFVEDGIPDDQKKIVDAFEKNQKSANVKAKKLLQYLKNSTAEWVDEVQTGFESFEKGFMEDEVKKRVVEAGGIMEKVNVCSQNYGDEIAMVRGSVLLRLVGCIIDQVQLGTDIVGASLKVSDEVLQHLAALIGSTDPTADNSVASLLGKIQQLSESFPVAEINTFLGSKAAQITELETCYKFKLAQFTVDWKNYVNNVIKCTN